MFDISTKLTFEILPWGFSQGFFKHANKSTRAVVTKIKGNFGDRFPLTETL